MRLLQLYFVFLLAVYVTAQEFDHRSHAVTGPDQTVYAGSNNLATVNLDGEGSHSHYFDAGPPVVTGVIEEWEWTLNDSTTAFCTTQTCTHNFSVGVSTVSLKVTDNTNDSSTDSMSVTVLPASDAVGEPEIVSIAPTSGSTSGDTTVTIKGENFFSTDDQLEVNFGSQPAKSIEVVSSTEISAVSPESAAGTVEVTVVTTNGASNGETFTYTDGSGAVSFTEEEWKNSDGTTFSAAQQVTGITIGQDGRYYMGTLDGKVHAADVGTDLKVKSHCSSQVVDSSRSIYAIAYNPADSENRLVISTNTQFWKNKGEVWYNGKVEWVDVGGSCVSHGGTVISGLPVSNHDHGVSGITFLPDGTMLVSVGGTSNAGVTAADDKLGGSPESPLSGAILSAAYLSAGFDGDVKYDQVSDPGTANVESGDVSVYAAGFRNAFGLTRSELSGNVYATDNGPNESFGAKSTSCTEETDDPGVGDSLYLINEGNYYGHPNRNRGRSDPSQCEWRGSAMTPAIASEMQPSTNAIVPYTSNVFGGQLKGDIFLAKAALGQTDNGLILRLEMNAAGTSVETSPYQFQGVGGLSMIEGMNGELIMPQVRKNRVVVLVPQTEATARQAVHEVMLGPAMTRVHPNIGPEAGGFRIFVTGKNFVETDVIRVGAGICGKVEIMTSEELSCVVPRGTGRVSVTVEKNGLTSLAYGPDFTYVAR